MHASSEVGLATAAGPTPPHFSFYMILYSKLCCAKSGKGCC